MKQKPWRRELPFYRYTIEIPTRYADVDTERHVNNVAILTLHAEARSRLHLTLFGRDGWLPQTHTIRLAAFGTDFLKVTHYPAPVTCGATLIALGERHYTLALGMFQEDECVGIQECRIGAWRDGRWSRLPDALRARLAEFGVVEEGRDA